MQGKGKKERETTFKYSFTIILVKIKNIDVETYPYFFSACSNPHVALSTSPHFQPHLSLSHNPTSEQLKIIFRNWTLKPAPVCVDLHSLHSPRELQNSLETKRSCSLTNTVAGSTWKWATTFNFPQILFDNTSCLRTTPTYFSAHAARWLCVDSQAVRDTNLKQRKLPTLFNVASGHIHCRLEYRHCTGCFISNRTSSKSITFFQSLAQSRVHAWHQFKFIRQINFRRR